MERLKEKKTENQGFEMNDERMHVSELTKYDEDVEQQILDVWRFG